MSLYFTYESRETPKLFTFFITAKLSLTKLSLGHIEKFKTLFNKLVLVVHVLRLTTQNFQVGHFKRTRRQRQRERHQTKQNKAVHVRCNSWCISLAVLCKKTMWNYQILRCLKNFNPNGWFFVFLFLELNAFVAPVLRILNRGKFQHRQKQWVVPNKCEIPK